MCKDIDNIRDKKYYKVHVDLKLKCQNSIRDIELSIPIIATSEQEARNIARHVSITNIKVDKVKLDFDLEQYIKEHNL
jgi:hypothetical protein